MVIFWSTNNALIYCIIINNINMFLLRKSFTYIFLITLIGSIFTYVIVARAYDSISNQNTSALNS